MSVLSLATEKCPVCGRAHTCPIRYVHVGEGALLRLPEVTEGYDRLLIVADENTFEAAGAEAVLLLGDKVRKSVVFPGDVLLVPDEAAVAAVEGRLGGIDMIVGVGSGVIQDLCKYVSHRAGLPYIVIATAPSMDGYASDGAAMILGGMKVTVPSGLPYALVADTAVLAAAPAEMIRAGYGDIVGKYSALSDWRLANLVTGEYFCPVLHDETLAIVERTAAASPAIASRSREAVGLLAEALIDVGFLMSYVGSSRPASGSEHHLSHFFEITGIVKGRDYLPHGIDVACSTVVTTALRERLLAATWERRPLPTEEERRDAITRIYGSVAEGCLALQDKAGSYRSDRVSLYLEREAEIRPLLSEVPSSERILALLREAGISMEEFYSLYGEDTLRDAVAYAKDLKDRYTVLWLAYELGIS